MKLQDSAMCESCEVQHDCADIYDVDGRELCERCKESGAKIQTETHSNEH